MQPDDIDVFLQRRAVPPPAASDFAERIIRAAQARVRKSPQTMWEEFVSMFALPHPSVAFAACVLFGIAAGVQMGDGLNIFQQDWSSFLYVNEGGWL